MIKDMFLGKYSRDEKKRFKAVEKALGVSFSNRDLLKRALTHKSLANEKKLGARAHNERLEFLGDAVLELVVSHHLMNAYPDAPEGELSKLRAAMVNEKTLSTFARDLKIGENLYLGKGEEMGQGRDKSSLLADAYEAVLGAIYLDRGFKKSFEVVLKHAKILLSKINHEGWYKDYKTELQERAQILFKATPRYRIVEEMGPDHNKTFRVDILIKNEVYGAGEGKSKKEAQQSAARIALEALENFSPPYKGGD